MITFASFLSDIARPVYERIAAYVADQIGEPAELLSGVGWEERHRMLDDGRVQVAFLCGLPYSQKFSRPDRPIELLAAPVMLPERYRGQPIYFTDVTVRGDSPFQSFADLRGKSWAYTNPESNSGYIMPRDHLVKLGETSGYFGSTVASGSHQASIRMVVDGAVDAAGIDSLVLDLEFKSRPELAPQVRIIESLGPCPIPPVVVSSRLPPGFKATLGKALLGMHETPQGRAILADGLIARFVTVRDADYDPIREMIRRAEAAGYLVLR